jgi:hypothetical protein
MSVPLKKSTYIYHDSLSIVDEMPDEMAGQFVKSLLRLMNGEEVLTDNFAIKVALHPFRNQFSRDQEAYEKQCEKNRINGAKGGRPPKTEPIPKNPSGLLKTQAIPNNPDTDTDTGTGTDTDIRRDNLKQLRKRKAAFGSLSNVLLSQEEMEKLKEKFKGETGDKIDTLSEYLAQKGAKYKSHYATILAWFWID